MELIPVIDLARGQVVRAKAGQREQYRPSASRLCASSGAPDVMEAFLQLYPFNTLYIADLDAIQGDGSNQSVVADLSRRFPDVEIWLDAGFTRPEDVEERLEATRLRPVLGSESQQGIADFGALLSSCVDARPVLSLDFMNDSFLGPPELLGSDTHWPEDIIIMELDRVGSGRGPLNGRLHGLRTFGRDHRFYIAGGVRGSDDLRELDEYGCAGVLLASALHDAVLGHEELADFARGR